MAYTLTGEKCGTIRFMPDNGTITKESLPMSVKITSNPIEDGSEINDHAFNSPDQFSISGTVIGSENDVNEKLKAMTEKHDKITYSGRIRVDSLVIQNYTPAYSSKNKNGFEFSVSFLKIKTVTAEYVEMGAVPLMSKQDAGKSASTVNASAVKADGLKTTVSASISTSAYSDYVNQYNSKPASDSGAASRATPSYTGIT